MTTAHGPTLVRHLSNSNLKLFHVLVAAVGHEWNDLYHGHGPTAKLCARFVSHLFACLDVPPPPCVDMPSVRSNALSGPWLSSTRRYPCPQEQIQRFALHSQMWQGGDPTMPDIPNPPGLMRAQCAIPMCLPLVISLRDGLPCHVKSQQV